MEIEGTLFEYIRNDSSFYAYHWSHTKVKERKKERKKEGFIFIIVEIDD